MKLTLTLIAVLMLAVTARTAEVTHLLAPAVKTASSLSIAQPTERAIFQRHERGVGEVPVEFAITDEEADTVEVCVLDRRTQSPVKDWQSSPTI